MILTHNVFKSSSAPKYPIKTSEGIYLRVNVDLATLTGKIRMIEEEQVYVSLFTPKHHQEIIA